MAEVRRTLSEPHIGHIGTLDPAATGVYAVPVKDDEDEDGTRPADGDEGDKS